MPNDSPQYRNEFKHLISRQDALILKSKLKTVMKCDPHVNKYGYYFIRSLYFDTYDDKAFFDKEDGVPLRNKYRIRYYDFNESTLKLENKIKHYGACLKPTSKISRAEVEKIVAGDYDFLKSSSDPLKREFYIQLTSYALVPKTVVDYTRTPFIYPLGNVRITIDADLKAPVGQIDFFSPDMPMCSIFPDESCILEIKYDNYIPDYISGLVHIPTAITASYSKYSFCRRFI